MFIIDYVYVPLFGTPYVAVDICDSFTIEPLNEKESRIELTHSAKNNNGELIKFNSFIIIPKQKISVQNYSESRQ